MNRASAIILIVATIIAVVGGFGYVLFSTTVANPAPTPGFFSEVNENVEVNRGHGWEPATVGMELHQSDSIRTNDGEAEIVFQESVLVEFKQHTEGTLEKLSKDSIRIKQMKGTFWNKVTKLFGVTNYQTILPYTTATVRGTGFLSKALDQDLVIVGEGEVGVRGTNQEIVLHSFEKAANKDSLETVAITTDERKEMEEDLADDAKRLKLLRTHIIHNYQWLVDQYKKKYGATDADIEAYLDKIDRGELDDAKLILQAPVHLPVMDRIKQIDDLIKEQERLFPPKQ